MHNIIKILQKPKIFVFTIFWMMILVVLGTLAQRDMGYLQFKINIFHLGSFGLISYQCREVDLH